ncbi:MAG: trans-sulfuration enzyme family protein [Phototrophicaceae bacterium]
MDEFSPKSQFEFDFSTTTQSVHGKNEANAPYNALHTPIVHTATYRFDTTQNLLDYMEQKTWGGGANRVEYARYGNPTIQDVEDKLALLDHGANAILFSSGMNAITTLLLTVLRAGQHLVMTDDCYSRTRQFALQWLKRFNIDVSIVPMGDYEAMEQAIIPQRTRFIISESPTNPFLRIVDLPRIVDIARRHQVMTMIDSTFATPINQKPLDFGVDFVVHSATKYLSGHNDILAGVLVGADAGRMKVIRDGRGMLGGMIDPNSAYLLSRGLKTLGIRVQQQNHTAQHVAEFLENHPQVERVWYPGLASHPDHAVATQQMKGFGGVVSFMIRGDMATTRRFIDGLKIPFIAPSLGGVESLIEQPAVISYYDKEPEERLALGMTDNLVRFAVGIEETNDILSDLAQALEQL